MFSITIGTWLILTGSALLIVAVCGYQNDKANAEYLKRLAEYMRLCNEKIENLDKNVQKMIDE